MANYFDPRRLELEDARQRLIQYGHLSKYKSGVKSLLRKELVEILATKSSGNGLRIFNPEYSDEAIYFLEYGVSNNESILVVESNPATAKNLRYVYDDLHIEVVNALLDEAVADLQRPVASAHFDFTGEFNSSTTNTHKLNQSLKDRLSNRTCLAYTHSDSYRSSKIALEFGLELWDDLCAAIPDVASYGGRFGLDRVDLGTPKCINKILWFNPSVLTWASNVLVHHDRYHVDLIDSCRYRQLQKTTSKPTRGNVYMNRCIIQLRLWDFDIHRSVEELFTNYRDKIN